MTTCPNCKHEFVNDSDLNADVFDNYAIECPNFLNLADEVLKHVRATGLSLLCKDDPKTLRMGFETNTTGPQRRWWMVRLTRLKDAWGQPEDSRAGIYRSYLHTVPGRAALAALWSAGREPTEYFKSDAPVA